MKMTLLGLAVFILSLTTTSMLASSTPVLDTTGHPVQQGVEYDVIPVDGNRGGLALDRYNTRCPLYVCEDLTPEAAASGGVPVTFAPLLDNETIIQTSTDFNIAFSTATNAVCGRMTVWKIGGFEEDTGKWYLTVGGSVGNPGVSTVSNWFKIKRVQRSYKFVFCPQVCDSCKVVCGDIGVVGGTTRKRLLGLSGVPLRVVFRRRVTDM